MNISKFIKSLADSGIRLTLEKEKIQVSGPKNEITPDLISKLKESKSELVRFLTKPDVRSQSIEAVDRISPLKLSYSQQRLWILDKIDGGSAHYNLPGALKLTGHLSYSALNRALADVVLRHESLRTCFSLGDNGEPIQVIKELGLFHVVTTNLSDLSGDALQQAVAQHASEEAGRAFDLSKDLMLRAKLLKVAADQHILLVTMHHIASDGWSVSILINEFSALYQAYVEGKVNPLEPLAIQYADYANWQREWLQGPVLSDQLDYWIDQLADLPSVHNLPLDYPRPRVQTFFGKTHRSVIDSKASQLLAKLCHDNGATLFMGLHAVFSVLLSRYSNESDIVVGVPIANREQMEVTNLIGFFVNSLVLRSDLSGDPTFFDLLLQSKHTLLEAYAHQQVPFEQIVEHLQPERSLAYSPLFQVMLVLQNYERNLLELPGLVISAVEQTNTLAKYDLTLNVVEGEQGLSLDWEYNTGLFKESSIERLAMHFELLLRSLVERPEEGVFISDMLNSFERHQQLVEWNATYAEYRKDKCVHELFEEQVESNQAEIAVIFEDENLTYAELNKKSNQLARYLIEEKIVNPDTLVGICVERSLDMVIAVLAVLKAGGAYVPLDPGFPSERILYMLEDSKVTSVLTQTHIKNTLSINEDIAICLDDVELLKSADKKKPDNIPINQLKLKPNHLAYVIYTSGSTGRPKGVCIEHGSLNNFLNSMSKEPGMCSGDILLSVTSLSFDIHTLELFMPLTLGGKLLLASKAAALDPGALISLIKNYKVSLMQATPSTWGMIMDHGGLTDISLTALCGGETMSSSLRDWFVNQKSMTVWCMYGPTETCVWSTVRRLDEDKQALIGKPIDNTQVFVMRKHMQLLPTGVPGELYIGGEGLAREYLNKPEETKNNFKPNPYYDENALSSSALLYKTGDLVRMLPGGSLEFLGRVDNQVKVRGFRVELGEIESTLTACSEVKNAVVVAIESGAGGKRLVAYLVPATPTNSKPNEKFHADETLLEHKYFIERVRQQLYEKLPDYMVPSVFTLLDTLPLTPNGKVDRKLLPEPDSNGQQAEYTAPRTETESAVWDVWRKLLGVEKIGIDDNFFGVGGHSILLVRMQYELGRKFERNVSIADLFEHTNIRSMASYLDGGVLKGKEEVKPNEGDGRSYNGHGFRPVAIIGMSCRFPDASDTDSFWENILSGKESLKEFSDEDLIKSGVSRDILLDKNYVKKGVVLDNIDMFDSDYFEFTPKEAEYTCPQQRLFLECSDEALESAGYGSKEKSRNVGVFVGAANSIYFYRNILPGVSSRGGLEDLIGFDKDFIATRTSYKLNLTGPSLYVSTACSSSLSAISQACLNLSERRCDMALVGAISIHQVAAEGYLHKEGGILSSDGHCRPFDRDSDGTRWSSGVGVVILKDYDSAVRCGDTIHAVIKGVGINNDGCAKMSYTAPSVEGQANAIKEALEEANVDPCTIGYIETHGTGTKLGDPIEVAGLSRALKVNNRKHYCALGSVKANIGHTDTAAGMAGLLKTILSLKNKKIPPSINFNNLNSSINLDGTPFYINTEPKEWLESGTPRRAGVSSFGIGGTNVHVVLEEAPSSIASKSSRKPSLLVVSAKNGESLRNNKINLKEHLRKNNSVNLSDVEFTLQVGRDHHRYREYFVCNTVDEAVKRMDAAGSAVIGNEQLQLRSELDPLVFSFTGELHRRFGFCWNLYQSEKVFQKAIERCAEIILEKIPTDIRKIYDADREKGEMEWDSIRENYGDTVTFSVGYGLAKLWMSWGIKPHAVVGSGVGEYVALCISEEMTLQQALGSICAGGVVSLDEERTQPLIVNPVAQDLIKAGATVESDTPQFSRIRKGSNELMTTLKYKRPGPGSQIVVFNIGSSTYPGCDVTECMSESNCLILSSFADEECDNEEASILSALGRFWEIGLTIDWKKYHQRSVVRRVPLPTYSFKRNRYWIDNSGLNGITFGQDVTSPKVDDECGSSYQQVERKVTQIWEGVLGVEGIDANSNFYEIGGDSLSVTDITSAIRVEFSVDRDSFPLQFVLERPTIAEISKKIHRIRYAYAAEENRKRLDRLSETDLIEGEI